MKDNLVYRLHRERLGDKGRQRQVFIENRWSNANSFHSYDLVSHYGCVNAIEFSHDGGYMVSAGDDRRVLLWNLQESLEGKGHVQCMAAEHRSNVFCLDTDHALTKIYSGGNDEQVIVHDAKTNELVDVFQHEEPVNGLSVHPEQPNLFVTACSDGRILLYDMRQPATSEALMIIGFSYAFHSVQFNPVEPRLLVGANQKCGIGLYDIRKPRSTVLRYHSRSSMHARFNSSGTQIVGLRKRLPPVLFNIQDPLPACEFDNPQYYNSCTMKSCCFGGPREQFIFSGSDDFNLYAWKIPEDKETTWSNRAHVIFKGHRSIVNQVRYNPHLQLLASSGVEKTIKLWSDWPFTAPGSHKVEERGARTVYTHEDYIGLVLRSDNLLHIDTQFRNTQENPRMMAFFDSLVQREIEGWDSEDDIEENHSSSNESSSSANGGGEAEILEGGGVAGFSHRSIGRRSRVLMERISVSIADDVMREERAIAEAQNTVGSNILNTSNDSSGSGSSDILPETLPTPDDNLEAERQVQTGRNAPQPANGSDSPANNRIAQLISQKRGHLIKAAIRRGKRLREMPDTVISKSIHHARKVLKISEPGSRFGSTSDESSEESDEEENIETQPSSSQPSSSPFPSACLKPSSSSSGSGSSSPENSGGSSRIRQNSSSSSESGDEFGIPGRGMRSSSPIPLFSVPLPSSPLSPTMLLDPIPSSSNASLPNRSTLSPGSSTMTSSRSTLPSSRSSTLSSSSVIGSSTEGLVTNPKDDTLDVEENRVDIASLLPSSSTSVNNRIKQLRKRRLKIEKEEESESESN